MAWTIWTLDLEMVVTEPIVLDHRCANLSNTWADLKETATTKHNMSSGDNNISRTQIKWFRPKKAGDDDFYMGRYVISPLEEAEQMRAKVNSQRPQSVAPSGGFHQSVQPPVSSYISNQQNSHASRRNETLVHFKFLSLAVRLMMMIG